MATKKQATGEVEAFILVDCAFGKAGEVVTLAQSEAGVGAAHGVLDLAPAAVENAKAK